MTDLTLDREQVEIHSAVTRTITVFLMVALFFGSFSLLSWAVDNRLATDKQVAQSSPITAEVRERQLGCLAKNIYHEAGSEPFEGKVAVAQVTINRTVSGLYPEDICRTVYQKNIIYEKVICQFSWVCDRAIMSKNVVGSPNYIESMEVAKKVLLEGFRLPALHQAMYFHGDYINPGWKRERIAKIGRHIFYK